MKDIRIRDFDVMKGKSVLIPVQNSKVATMNGDPMLIQKILLFMNKTMDKEWKHESETVPTL